MDNEKKKEEQEVCPEDEFCETIEMKEKRRIRAKREGDRSVWFGLGTFGLIGWSVAIPTLIGVAIGLWIDSFWEGSQSWTLMLLFAGVVLGCINAWYWLNKEGAQ